MSETKPLADIGMSSYRAPSLFQPHRVRQAVLDAYHGLRPRLFAYYMGLSTVPTARVVATLGYDAVWVDWEHSSCGVETMTTIVHEIQFMSEGKTVPWVRVPGHDHAAIGFALDAGASIIVPQVDTVEQARHICSATKYGSKSHGTRSYPPFRLLPGITDTMMKPDLTFAENINSQAALMIQIESLEGINNLDAILTACGEHIDLVWLGTLDLRTSMNLPGWPTPDRVEPEWLDALQLFHDTCKKHDKPTGGAAFGHDVETVRTVAKDNTFIGVTADIFGLLYGSAGALGIAREAILDMPLREKTRNGTKKNGVEHEGKNGVQVEVEKGVENGKA